MHFGGSLLWWAYHCSNLSGCRVWRTSGLLYVWVVSFPQVTAPYLSLSAFYSRRKHKLSSPHRLARSRRFSCSTTPCSIGVDDCRGRHWYQVQVVSSSGTVIASMLRNLPIDRTSDLTSLSRIVVTPLGCGDTAHSTGVEHKHTRRFPASVQPAMRLEIGYDEPVMRIALISPPESAAMGD
jgi:hypothetical protein